MAFNLKESRPVKGLVITNTEDSKFTTETIIIRFITPVEPVFSQHRVAAISMLTDGCADYPNKTLLSKKLAGLYGAHLFSFSYRVGNSQVSGLTISSIGDKYTINGENITVECAELLLKCIFEPAMENGRFNEEIFSNGKLDLINKVKSSADNRHSYALKRAAELAFEGEPSAINLIGELETAEAITNDQLVSCYRSMLKDAYISISFCGGGTNKEAQKLIADRMIRFASERNYTGDDLKGLTAVSHCKAKPEYVCETIEQSQSKLVMMLKTESSDEFALKLAGLIYGGTPFSRLFMNVREKLSLCYYCQTSNIEGKGTMLVDSGVGPGNERIACDEILAQLKAMQNGDITEEELEDTKRYYIGSLRSVQDYSDDQNSWFFSRFVKGDLLTPQQAEELVKEVTLERVKNAICSYTLDTVYMLLPDNTEGGNENE